ncbi:riboflavin synthase alpha chain [Ruminococcus flavefaciens]|uniref:Riboflavin synthase n=1 Tax=Ruminococcus flavefaciens TaxID=1265 RepID=A0A1H6L692_RUMFL|nr:riboflavin synthase [Ruminococcus flavefaciens]SEH81415.1 riboflavin synthase alpha chain [Ruminococcus flavefaciens]
MFTGIIEEIGTVNSVKQSGSSSFIEIQAKKVLEDVHIGDSIAVNGVCLTVTHFDGGVFRADVMNETLSRSSLGKLTSGSPVNLERAMAANGRFGGHIVSGHIDGTGTVTDIKNDGIAVWYTVSAAPELLHYIVEKGSIAIDGISLTVAKVTETSFSVSIIPHTAAQTILGSRKVGDIVNLENDIIGKYVEKLMKPAESPKTGGITMEFLMKNGY